MANAKIKRTEAIEGTLVSLTSASLYDGEYVYLGYYLHGEVYVVENSKTAVLVKNRLSLPDEYCLDGGKRYMDWIRDNRKNAKTPYKIYPMDISSLTDVKNEAFKVIKNKGGIISRKELADIMGVTK